MNSLPCTNLTTKRLEAVMSWCALGGSYLDHGTSGSGTTSTRFVAQQINPEARP